MKKNFLLSFFTVVFSIAAIAQSAVYSPGKTVNSSLSADGFAKIDLLIFNNTGDSLDIGWNLVSNGLPNGWDYSLCDFGTCYPGIPGNGKMQRIGVSDTAFLKINLSPMNIAGSGTVIFVVEPKIGEKDTIVFNISASPLSVSGTEPGGSVCIFPNPASDFLVIDQGSTQKNTILISDITGTIVKKENLFPGKNILPVYDLPEGVYFLSFPANGLVETKKIVVSR